MKIIETRNYDHMSRQAANLLSAQVIWKPDSILGLATGSSPIGTYEQLIDRYRGGDLDFSRVRTVNLDEYVGLDAENEQSYAYFMRRHFWGQVNLRPENTHIPHGGDPDAERECARYDALLRDLGGIDLQLLGLGPNGHIGFNEPGDRFEKGTHRAALEPATIRANRRFFNREEDVPRFAYTMGIADIMRAERVVMIVSGEAKAGILKAAFAGPITPRVPASILQLHRDFTLVADRAALRDW